MCTRTTIPLNFQRVPCYVVTYVTNHARWDNIGSACLVKQYQINISISLHIFEYSFLNTIYKTNIFIVYNYTYQFMCINLNYDCYNSHKVTCIYCLNPSTKRYIIESSLLHCWHPPSKLNKWRTCLPDVEFHCQL